MLDSSHVQPTRSTRHHGLPMAAAPLIAVLLSPMAGASDSLLTHVAGLTDADARLAALESALQTYPDDARLGNAFRSEARAQGRVQHARVVLEALNGDHPQLGNLAANLALAHLDGIGASGADPLKAGIAAHRADRVLSAVLSADPTHVPALYARALSRLVWPAGMRRAAAAVRDLELCVLALEEQQAPPAALARVYVLMGDAHAKNRSFGEARAAYETGRSHAPDSEAIETRLALEPTKVAALADDLYRLDRSLDTDLTFLLDPSSSE